MAKEWLVLINLNLKYHYYWSKMVLDGLEALSKRGVRYPIPFAGAQLDVITKLPGLYRKIYEIEEGPPFTDWKRKSSTAK